MKNSKWVRSIFLLVQKSSTEGLSVKEIFSDLSADGISMNYVYRVIGNGVKVGLVESCIQYAPKSLKRRPTKKYKITRSGEIFLKDIKEYETDLNTGVTPARLSGFFERRILRVTKDGDRNVRRLMERCPNSVFDLSRFCPDINGPIVLMNRCTYAKVRPISGKRRVLLEKLSELNTFLTEKEMVEASGVKKNSISAYMKDFLLAGFVKKGTTDKKSEDNQHRKGVGCFVITDLGRKQLLTGNRKGKNESCTIRADT